MQNLLFKQNWANFKSCVDDVAYAIYEGGLKNDLMQKVARFKADRKAPKWWS